MTPLFSRFVAGILAGALSGPLALVLVYARAPEIVLEMDRPIGAVSRGFFDVERAGEHTFAWARREASVRLPGLAREVEWTCTLRLRAPRPPGSPPPEVRFGVDGVTTATRTAGLVFHEVEVRVPPRGRDGLLLSVASSNTFVPGGGDARELALEVDRIACRPAEGEVVLPPGAALAAAAGSAAAFGALAAVCTLTLPATVLAVVVLGALQALPLALAPGPYTSLPDRSLWLALSLAAVSIAGLLVGEKLHGRPLSRAARFVVFFSAALVFLRLVVLLHPAKLVVDALFQAHRLEWVLSGRYLFTQPMPSGVRFPYAIGLYVFSIPWTWLTRDYVTLLRVVCVVMQAVAGGLLYTMVVRWWRDRRTGALAVVLFHLAPLSFWFIGNGNLTNAFGEATALIAVAAAVVWRLGRGDVPGVAALLVLAAGAFLSHISTFPLLASTLLLLGTLAWWRGGTHDRAAGRSILLATAGAASLAVVLYYGHFGEAYESALRVRAARESPAAAAPAPNEAASMPGPAAAARVEVPLASRALSMADVAPQALGWPMLVLAAVGLWRLLADRPRDRLALALLAWAGTWLAFLAFSIFSPVAQPFLRYAVEFVGRVVHATYPAAAIVAARGAAWGLEGGSFWRAGVVGLLALAAAAAAAEWLRWLR